MWATYAFGADPGGVDFHFRTLLSELVDDFIVKRRGVIDQILVTFEMSY